MPPRTLLVGCQVCSTLVGCQRCTDTKFGGPGELTKPCPECRAPRGLAKVIPCGNRGNINFCLSSRSKNIMTRNQQLRFPFFSSDLIVKSFSICIFVSEAHLEIHKPSLLRKCMGIRENLFFSTYKDFFFVCPGYKWSRTTWII